MYFAPVCTHLFTVFAAGVEVGDLIGAEHIVHVLGQLRLQRGHHGELLANKNLSKQLMRSGKDHGLLLEILNMGAFGKELRHIVHLVSRLARKAVAGPGRVP